MSEYHRRLIENTALARAEAPWEKDAPDTLDPEGDTVYDVLDHWMACRADTFEHHPVLKQTRYCLTDGDVRRIAEHIEKWLEGR